MTKELTLRDKMMHKDIMKPLALFSIAVYIALMTIFESQSSSLASLSSIGIYFCLGVCGVYVISRKKVKFNWLFFALVLFGIILSISAFYTPASQSVVSTYLYRFWTSVALLFLVYNVPENEKDMDFLLSVVVLSGMILAFYMYGFYGWDYLLNSSERLDAEFGNQNYTSMRCAFSIIFAVFKVITGKRKVLRFLWLIPAAVCVPAVMFLASRKSILVIAAALIIFLFSYSKNKNPVKKILLIALVVLVLWILIYTVPAFSVVKDRFEEMFTFFGGGSKSDMNEGDINRQHHIERGLAAFRESPFFGNGFYFSAWRLGVHSHNNYVELLMNNGLVGFCLYYFIHVKLLFDAHRIKKISPKAHALVFSLVIGFLVMDIGVVSYYDRAILLYMMLCAMLVNKKLYATNQPSLDEKGGKL